MHLPDGISISAEALIFVKLLSQILLERLDKTVLARS